MAGTGAREDFSATPLPRDLDSVRAVAEINDDASECRFYTQKRHLLHDFAFVSDIARLALEPRIHEHSRVIQPVPK
jgi:hypothetical protein